METKPLIYFLCTGNSCRSQIAEGFAKYYGGEKFKVFSAGIESHSVNPTAIQVMAEVGIDISNQTSDLIDENILTKSDYVITLCGDANDKCPVTPPGVNREHWNLPDPAKSSGNEKEIIETFRMVRDAIKEEVMDLLKRSSPTE
ncbi:arsenate reductase (thioredoxin) [Pelotomaculum terephthalicicum JT]|uniref:arsenate reductase (thioredoxin) n=1 Tax=Pelotomaculum TaxID=191373 RepID=UPI0009CB5862|nr:MULTISPECIES: arsenate reductase (thioredoxin) [Pelotomaculum]MCG9967656.1 arsenate reductase (thioredoxin) [Pelotomaculum terephthalicicum JT]OPX84048.1 MAG: Arsenate-mycothiol transferase ArsC1 [Pelotomaculum sp. PtaB.Bin117]OPY59409.1 MAG: Arsenate-mycothiol transferase ArsC1 [Pelotomaculum sp. PtaU1.Bin065]